MILLLFTPTTVALLPHVVVRQRAERSIVMDMTRRGVACVCVCRVLARMMRHETQWWWTCEGGGGGVGSH